MTISDLTRKQACQYAQFHHLFRGRQFLGSTHGPGNGALQQRDTHRPDHLVRCCADDQPGRNREALARPSRVLPETGVRFQELQSSLGFSLPDMKNDSAAAATYNISITLKTPEGSASFGASLPSRETPPEYTYESPPRRAPSVPEYPYGYAGTQYTYESPPRRAPPVSVYPSPWQAGKSPCSAP